MRARDDATLEVELEAPLVYFPSLVNFMVTFPLRRDLVERFGERWTDPGNLVSLGPFTLAEWRHEYRLVLRANERYWAGRPALDRIDAYMVQEPSTGARPVRAGPARPGADSRRSRSAATTAGPSTAASRCCAAYYYGFNTRLPPFDDRARAARLRARDRPLAVPAAPARRRAGLAVVDPAGHARRERRRSACASIPSARGRCCARPGVDPATLAPVQIVFNSDPTHKLVAEKVQAFWRENLGVRVELVNREWKVFLKELQNQPPPVFRLGWGADFPDPDNFMNLFTSYSENNHTGWANPHYDDAGRSAPRASPTRRAARRSTTRRSGSCARRTCRSCRSSSRRRTSRCSRACAASSRSPMDLFFFEQVSAE